MDIEQRTQKLVEFISDNYEERIAYLEGSLRLIRQISISNSDSVEAATQMEQIASEALDS